MVAANDGSFKYIIPSADFKTGQQIRGAPG